MLPLARVAHIPISLGQAPGAYATGANFAYELGNGRQLPA
jgi:hypothetical protein